MQVKRVLYALNGMLPGKKILLLPEKNPKEIICEVEPTENHPEYSVAIAIIDTSAPHVHYNSTERYEVIRGTITLYINDVPHLLKEGQKIKVKPGQIHYAVGDETWVKVTSTPGWIPKDHMLVKAK